jgi:hypothetical protein
MTVMTADPRRYTGGYPHTWLLRLFSCVLGAAVAWGAHLGAPIVVLLCPAAVLWAAVMGWCALARDDDKDDTADPRSVEDYVPCADAAHV